MSYHTAGVRDSGYEENGKLCHCPDCGLAAIHRFDNGSFGWTYVCDDHESWGERNAREWDCSDCGNTVSNWKILDDSDDGIHFTEMVLCPCCYTRHINERRAEHPDDFDKSEGIVDDVDLPEELDDDDDWQEPD